MVYSLNLTINFKSGRLFRKSISVHLLFSFEILCVFHIDTYFSLILFSVSFYHLDFILQDTVVLTPMYVRTVVQNILFSFTLLY